MHQYRHKWKFFHSAPSNQLNQFFNAGQRAITIMVQEKYYNQREFKSIMINMKKHMTKQHCYSGINYRKNMRQQTAWWIGLLETICSFSTIMFTVSKSFKNLESLLKYCSWGIYVEWVLVQAYKDHIKFQPRDMMAVTWKLCNKTTMSEFIDLHCNTGNKQFSN